MQLQPVLNMMAAGGPLLGGGGGLPTLFDWNPETAQALPATATFTRASVAQVLTTTDGSTFWDQEAKSGELRLDGLRRVENFVTNSLYEDLDTWAKLSGGAGSDPVVTSSIESPPLGTTSAVQQVTFDAGGTGGGDFSQISTNSINGGVINDKLSSMYLRTLSGTATLFFDSGLGGAGRRTITVTTTWQRFAAGVLNNADGVVTLGLFGPTGGVSANVLAAVDGNAGPQHEDLQSGKTAPNAIVDPSTTYNAEVAGVRYFNTTNGNSVDGNGVVTEADGATITDGGYLGEPVNLPQEADVVDSGITIPGEFSALFDFTAPATIGGGETPSLLGAATSAVNILGLDASFNVIMDDGGTPTTIGTVSANQRFKVSYGRDGTGRSGSLDGATAVTGDAPASGHEGETFQLYSTASVNQARGRGHLSTIYSARLSNSELEDISA